VSNRDDLRGRVGIVPAAARNIGPPRSPAPLADAGASVVVNAKTSARRQRLVAREIRDAGGQAAVRIADISTAPTAAAAANRALSRRSGGRHPGESTRPCRREIDFEKLSLRGVGRDHRTILDGAYLCAHAALAAPRRVRWRIDHQSGCVSMHLVRREHAPVIARRAGSKD